MTVTTFGPRRNLDSFHHTVRRMFQDFDAGVYNLQPASRQGAFVPSFDINEDKKNLYFVADLPGLTADQMTITVSDDVLTVRGERKRTEQHAARHYYRLERRHGDFVRQFTLPQDVKEEDIQANFEHGVLEIIVPKREPAKPKEHVVHIGGVPSPLAAAGAMSAAGATHEVARAAHEVAPGVN